MRKSTLKTLMVSVLVLVFTLLPAMAFAAPVGAAINIYVDGSRINVGAYIGADGGVKLNSSWDLIRIFPILTNLQLLPSNNWNLSLENCIAFFGYTASLNGNNLYISTNGSNSSTPYIRQQANVYVNGAFITSQAYVSSKGEICIDDNNLLYKIFPAETRNTYFTTAREETTLKSWADRYGYKYIVSGNNAYLTNNNVLNNNNNIYISNNVTNNNNNNNYGKYVVTINGIPHYINEEPIVVPPGRSMLSLATTASLFDCQYKYDKSNNKILFQFENGEYFIFTIGRNVFTFNGRSYTADVSPLIQNGTVLVPISVIAKTLGYSITISNN